MSSEKNRNQTPKTSCATFQSTARRELVQAGGGLFQLLGLPRSTGRIYALLYLSAEALSLDDIVRILSISKASASIGTRHLAAWGVVRQVWKPGDRRDHFEAVGELDRLLCASFSEFAKSRLDRSERRLAEIVQALEEDLSRGSVTKDEYDFCADRLRRLSRYQASLQNLGPVAEKLLFLD